MAYIVAFLVLGTVAVSALPADPIVRKFDEGPRYQHMTDDSGDVHLVDSWLKASDLARAARYNPDAENAYHLFTRQNPSLSQPLLLGSTAILDASNFDPRKNTVVIIHGWTNHAASTVNAVLVPAFLMAADVNVIVVDWFAGGGDPNYFVAVVNTVTSGEGVARFINWLNAASGATPAQYHIVGHSLGGQQAGIVGRNVNGDVAYITALDPAAPSWGTNENKFRATDAAYTEVIHTNVGILGYLSALGDVDFYPNGGINMPGCDGMSCDHDRCFYYLAESLTSGGFTGVECRSLVQALLGSCSLNGRLRMGGILPKTGASGMYYLQTNAGQPFSQG